MASLPNLADLTGHWFRSKGRVVSSKRLRGKTAAASGDIKKRKQQTQSDHDQATAPPNTNPSQTTPGKKNPKKKHIKTSTAGHLSNGLISLDQEPAGRTLFPLALLSLWGACQWSGRSSKGDVGSTYSLHFECFMTCQWDV